MFLTTGLENISQYKTIILYENVILIFFTTDSSKVDTEDFQAFAFKSIDPHFTRSFSSTIRFVYLVTLLVRLIGSDSPRPRRILRGWNKAGSPRRFWGEIADKHTEPVLGSKCGNFFH